MKDELEDLASHWLRALIKVEVNKVRVARWYDKKIRVKEFSELILKLILLVGTKDKKDV